MPAFFTILNIAQINIRGLTSTKQGYLIDAVKRHSWDIVGITESHLIESFNSSYFSIPSFTLFRHDSPDNVSKHGVCCYVRNSLMVDSVTKSLPNTLTFRLVQFNVFILVVYRPPSNSPIENERLADFMTDFCSDKEVIIVGDLNLPTINWVHDDQAVGCSALDRVFLEVFLSLGLTQWVREPTFPRSGNILDIVLTTEPDRVGTLDVLPPLPSCDHCPTSFEYVFSDQCVHIVSETPQRRAWHRGKYRSICKRLSDIDWNFELSYRDVNDSYSFLVSVLTGLVEEFVPLQPADRGPPWPSRPPASLTRRCQDAWRAFKEIRCRFGRTSDAAASALDIFLGLNKQRRDFSVRSQAAYENGLVGRLTDNPKLLHSYIRSKKVGRLTVGPIKLSSGHLSDDAGVMAEALADAFSAVYTRDLPQHPAPHQVFCGSIETAFLSVDIVMKALQDLDGNSAMGPDGLHPMLLKSCAAHLAYPLYIVFRRSLMEGTLPDAWMISHVVPIFKKGSRYDPLNYRPISLTSVCCKTMERILCQHLTDYLDTNSLLSPHQFGFRAGRSTLEQLLLVYDTVSRCTDVGGTVDVILFDFSKAFDVVVHELIVSKLSCLGIQGPILQWVKYFLMGKTKVRHDTNLGEKAEISTSVRRTMQVCIQGHTSKSRDVLSGVPQGSVLGPLLFLVYINSVASSLRCQYKIFADDLKIYACVRHTRLSETPVISHQCVQDDINKLHDTALSWGLHMNVAKCAVLSFSGRHNDDASTYFLNGREIPKVSSAKDLGVLVDTDLKFHTHIRTVCQKAGGLTQNLLKSTVSRSPEFMMFLYKTHVRPILEYCSSLWNTGYLQDLRLLERVQRRWTKRISGLETLSYADRLQSLQLYSVQGRLIRSDLLLCWKIFHGKSLISPDDLFLVSPLNHTRGHSFKIRHPHSGTDVRQRFFSVRIIDTWNSLPDRVVNATNIDSFKKMLNDYIPDVLYCYVD